MPPSETVHYTQTQTGALLAAINSQMLLDTASDERFGDILRTYFAPGPGLTAYSLARAQVHMTGTINRDQSPLLTAFRFLQYSSERAVVEVLFTQPDGSINGLMRTLVWASENWLIELPDPKDTAVVMQAYRELPDDVHTLDKEQS